MEHERRETDAKHTKGDGVRVSIGLLGVALGAERARQRSVFRVFRGRFVAFVFQILRRHEYQGASRRRNFTTPRLGALTPHQ